MGRGNVNGVEMRNCIRLVTYEDGYLLETKKMFGAVSVGCLGLNWS
jgi:hypothetical protein